LIKNDKDSEKLSEEIKTTLENITANLKESLSSNGMRPALAPKEASLGFGQRSFW
jgi:hypothetical protein